MPSRPGSSSPAGTVPEPGAPSSASGAVDAPSVLPERQGSGLRIAIVGQGNFPIPSSQYAPVEKHIAGLAEALRRRGEDVHIVNRVLPRFRLRLLVHALWVSRQLRRLRPDVIHCHSPINAWVLRRLGHAPIVSTSHSREWVASRTTGYAGSAELRNHVRGFRASHARIVLSEEVRKAVAATPGLQGAPCHVIPNGVDATAYTVPDASRSGRLIVGLGVVARLKRWHLLAQAIQGTQWRLEIVGPLNHPDYAEELAAMPGVTVRGPLDEEGLRDALHRARVLGHPSRAEAMSLAVLEGMATGLPVLGSHVLRGVVESAETGWLVPERRETEQVERYRALLRDTPMSEWDRMGAQARAVVLEKYTWDAVAQRTLQVYAEAARRFGRKAKAAVQGAERPRKARRKRATSPPGHGKGTKGSRKPRQRNKG